MKFKLLPLSGKSVWQNNKPFILFVLCLLVIHSVLKIIFYNYNYHLLFTSHAISPSGFEKLNLIKWSLAADLLVVLGINSFLLFALTAGRLVHLSISKWIIIPAFTLLNSFAVLLNLVDIFYFRFHFQRANADLLYVVDHPFSRLFQQNIFIILIFFVALASIIYLMWVLHKRFFNRFIKGAYCYGITVMLIISFAVITVMAKTNFSKVLVPTYPMLQLSSNKLPVVQNSFHTFFYSVFRNGGQVPPKKYMSDAACDSLISIKKQFTINQTGSGKKNIVLFIMESVPYDFFDSLSQFKVAMPFFDSLLNRSSFYNNAFCYAHESNKGITAILAGIPTLSDIPLYHSQYINMPITPVGRALQQLNYTSLFCIGDEYDNFGFAKCMNWLGIDEYYSKESIPDYKKFPKHSMGLQDEHVLGFFNSKLKQQQQPFFGVHYNISTHYPYDIPDSFAATLPQNYTAPMKSMRYYDYSLQKFFSNAEKEAWFNNTVFIFCSDHWMFPEGVKGTYNAVNGYRIPIIIYDPTEQNKQVINRPVSQFDITGTILATAGYKDSIISYGGNLLDSSSLSPYVFSKPNSSIYQVTDEEFVLGYNIVNDKVEYLYHYKKDSGLKENLVAINRATEVLHKLTRVIQAFLQKTGNHFNGKKVQ
ncbi:MAG: sulfatase-like hydrolase/transferase [Ferruginibacter sp.]